MKFPYPESHEDWQVAYTRDRAHKEAGKYSARSNLAFFLCVIIVSINFAILAARFIDFSLIDPRYVWVLALALMAFVALAFLAAYSQARKFAIMFLEEFYQPKEGIDLSKLIKHRLNGVRKWPPPLSLFIQFPYILVRDGEILKSDKWPAWMSRNLGGPLMLIIFDGTALYVERGNRFSRVVGPGDKTPFLEWYETIKYVVDFRPKTHVDKIDVWTKDGIKLNLTIQIECRIGDPKKHDPASNLVYPYDPVAVKKAIERISVRWPDRLNGGPSDFTWLNAAWGQVTSVVPNYIGSRMLDDLLIADRASGQILSANAAREIFDSINHATQPFGVYVTDFQMLEIKIPEEVEEAQKEQWKAERQSIATVIDGEAKAFSIRAREKAKADAQRDLILAIAEGLEKNRDGRFVEPLLLSLSGVLDESLRAPYTRTLMASETLETLEQLQKMLKDRNDE